MTTLEEVRLLETKLQSISQLDIAGMVETLDVIIAQLTTIRTDLSALSMINTAELLTHVNNALDQMAAFKTGQDTTLGIL